MPIIGGAYPQLSLYQFVMRNEFDKIESLFSLVSLPHLFAIHYLLVWLVFLKSIRIDGFDENSIRPPPFERRATTQRLLNNGRHTRTSDTDTNASTRARTHRTGDSNSNGKCTARNFKMRIHFEIYSLSYSGHFNWGTVFI